MKPGEIWVIPRGDRWLITQQGKPGNLGVFDSERDAVTRGRALATATQVDLVIKTVGGWVRERVKQRGLDSRGQATPERGRSVNRDIWVVPASAGMWGVKLALASSPFTMRLSRNEAIDAGRELARESSCVLVILDEEGRVDTRENYLEPESSSDPADAISTKPATARKLPGKP